MAETKPVFDLINYDRMLNKMSTGRYTFYKFAYCGNEKKGNGLSKYIEALAKMAEPENWTSTNSTKANDILENYIVNTFEKAYKDHILAFSPNKDYCAFNTGLLTPNGEDIICLFNEFTKSDFFLWHLYEFKNESDTVVMNHFSSTPNVPMYFDKPEKLYFDPTLEIVNNFDHILDDNFDRFPKELQQKGKASIISLLDYSVHITLKRCRRNYRIAVPQYYQNEITYLIPVDLDGTTMALAVSYLNGRYRANTIFTLEMAYKNARLLMKPEADWLQNKK